MTIFGTSYFTIYKHILTYTHSTTNNVDLDPKNYERNIFRILVSEAVLIHFPLRYIRFHCVFLRIKVSIPAPKGFVFAPKGSVSALKGSVFAPKGCLSKPKVPYLHLKCPTKDPQSIALAPKGSLFAHNGSLSTHKVSVYAPKGSVSTPKVSVDLELKCP